jgi:hypothetical protein
MYNTFLKSKIKNTFQNKIAYLSCWLPHLNKYMITNLVSIFLKLIIEAQEFERHV